MAASISVRWCRNLKERIERTLGGLTTRDTFWLESQRED